jgi:CelD/BcsL family acetyltransferase involved in cellulose biosynthesis
MRRSLQGAVIRDREALEALEEPWWRLWRRCRAATPFQSPAWLLAWWRSFSPGELAAIAVRDDSGDLVGLFPLYLERRAGHARLLPLGISVSDYLGVLVDDERGAGVARELACEFAALPWDSCCLADIPGQCLALALAVSGGSDWADEQSCPVVDLAGGEDLSGCVPARRRRQLRRAWAAAERRGPVEISPLGRTDAFLGEIARLHGLRWAGRGEGVLSDPAVLRFHRLALPALVEGGLARCFILSIGGQPVAAYYGLMHGERAYAYLGGFDPLYAAESPGSILIGHAIATALREGAREFHFLRGREAYKYSWGAVDRRTCRITRSRRAAA